MPTTELVSIAQSTQQNKRLWLSKPRRIVSI